MTKRGSATARTKKQKRKEREARRQTAAEKELERESLPFYSNVDGPGNEVAEAIIDAMSDDPPDPTG